MFHEPILPRETTGAINKGLKAYMLASSIMQRSNTFHNIAQLSKHSKMHRQKWREDQYSTFLSLMSCHVVMSCHVTITSWAMVPYQNSDTCVVRYYSVIFLVRGGCPCGTYLVCHKIKSFPHKISLSLSHPARETHIHTSFLCHNFSAC